MFVALVSAKGSPGVTTATLALAHAMGDDRTRLVLEIDPSGGDLEVLTGHHGRPGMPSVAAALRHGFDPDAIREAATDLPGGIPAVLAQPGGFAAEATLATMVDRLGPAVDALAQETVVLGDAGRWSRHQVTARRIDRADLVLVVTRPAPGHVEHARWLVEELRAVGPHVPIAVLAVGDRPYPRAELEPIFDVPVLGPLAWDRTGTAALYAGAADRWRWRWTLLGRSARQVVDDLLEHAEEGSRVAG